MRGLTENAFVIRVDADQNACAEAILHPRVTRHDALSASDKAGSDLRHRDRKHAREDVFLRRLWEQSVTQVRQHSIVKVVEHVLPSARSTKSDRSL